MIKALHKFMKLKKVDEKTTKRNCFDLNQFVNVEAENTNVRPRDASPFTIYVWKISKTSIVGFLR